MGGRASQPQGNSVASDANQSTSNRKRPSSGRQDRQANSEASSLVATMSHESAHADSTPNPGDTHSRCSNRRSAKQKDRPTEGKKPGFLRQLSQGYEELVKAIIRPPRAYYEVSDLGPASFRVAGRQFQRTEISMRNPKGMQLECSWWEPKQDERISKELPCVIYMHGNSSCRLEAIELLPMLLQTGCTLFAFDFAGCGLSEGEHITLGYLEKEDARTVIDFLRASGKVSTIALWGRSMGAATALLHGHRDPSIAAMVLDSPFSSLERLAREVIDQAQLRHKPEFLVKAFMRMVRSTILKRSGLDILKLKPIQHVDTCFIPALFVAGKSDQFIPPTHTTDISEKYAGDKNVLLVDGNHNSRRPGYFMDSVGIFFFNRLCRPAGLSEEALGLRPRSAPSSVPVSSQARDSAEFGCSRHESSRDPGINRGREIDDESELQEALLASLSQSVNPPVDSGTNGMTGRLVACATNRVQSTMPDRRTAAGEVIL